MITRRALLKSLALLGASATLSRRLSAAEKAPPQDKLGPLLSQRTLGKTGLKVSLLSVGGSHVGRPAIAEAERIIETAIELGIRTFETAQLYQNGGSEERYGKFLTPKYREQVLIFTKTMARDRRTAEEHLNGSLRRMKIDYVDLWQMHDIGSPEDVDERLRNGVLDFMLEAKASGKVRHLGFSGHTTWRAHAHLLAQTDVFETCLMPINVADVSYESFILNILPKLTERNMGVLAMKTLAAGDLSEVAMARRRSFRTGSASKRRSALSGRCRSRPWSPGWASPPMFGKTRVTPRASNLTPKPNVRR